MEILSEIASLLVAIGIAFTAGKLIAKLRLPSILGWLIAGMTIGPHALNILGNSVLEAEWFGILESIFECTFGLMIGSELIWKQMKKAGSQILVTTITESLGTFFVVSLVFGIIFWFADVPLYLAFMFGGIALATAPAPSLSVVNDMQTSGPVTRTLIPMAALDDLVGALVFLPVLLGAAIGFVTGKVLQHIPSFKGVLAVTILMLLVTAGTGFVINSMLPAPVLNFMLLGLAYFTAIANMVTEEQLNGIMKVMNPVIGFAMIVVILNLGAPLDYHLIFGAGIYTAVYIISRAVGKYSGAYFGAAITHAPVTVKKYLGFTLLPHSGVSLVFTGIAVSVLSGAAPECASIIQGTIAAAAVINEVIAVFMAKKGFEWAGELGKAKEAYA